jgi:hypothetical protein
MSDVTMALSLPTQYEFYKVEIGRGNKDTNIDWVTCFFAERKRELEACSIRTDIQCSFTFATSQVFRSAFFRGREGVS